MTATALKSGPIIDSAAEAGRAFCDKLRSRENPASEAAGERKEEGMKKIITLCFGIAGLLCIAQGAFSCETSSCKGEVSFVAEAAGPAENTSAPDHREPSDTSQDEAKSGERELGRFLEGGRIGREMGERITINSVSGCTVVLSSGPDASYTIHLDRLEAKHITVAQRGKFFVISISEMDGRFSVGATHINRVGDIVSRSTEYASRGLDIYLADEHPALGAAEILRDMLARCHELRRLLGL